jgi:hypothetical protein
MYVMTDEGYILRCSLENIMLGKKTPFVNNLNIFSIDNIKLWLSNNSKNFTILENQKYINNSTKLSFICKEHGIFINNWGNIQNGRCCKKCSTKNMSEDMIKKSRAGIFCIYNAEKYKEQWGNIDSLVYIIKCENNEEIFYKIGVTKTGIKKRFESKLNMPYDYKIVKKFDMNLYDAVYYEYYLHSINSKNKYNTKINFGGDSECFSSIMYSDDEFYM